MNMGGLGFRALLGSRVQAQGLEVGAQHVVEGVRELKVSLWYCRGNVLPLKR